MQSRGLLKITGVLLVLILLVGACSAGFVLGRVISLPTERAISFLPSVNPFSITSIDPGEAGTPEELEALFTPFWQSWFPHSVFTASPLS